MKFKYILLSLVLIFPSVKVAHSNQTLKCVTTDYRLSARYTKSWGMSWIPELFNIKLDSNGIKLFGKNATVTENSENKLKFYIKNVHNNQNYTIRKFTYFKSNGKFAVDFNLPGGYADPGSIWGECSSE